VRIFSWKLSQEGLATQCNRKRRTLSADATCQICGTEEESGYHAVIRCTKAVALHHEIRSRWLLPDEHQFHYTGPDWLLVMLSTVSAEEKANTLLLWRVWHLRNDAIYGKGSATIQGSVLFLINYGLSLKLARCSSNADPDNKRKGKIREGKQIKVTEVRIDCASANRKEQWTTMQEGWIKLNTDAGYCPNTGEASAGMVARDDRGRVMLTTWRTLSSCASPEEAEAGPCLQGLRLIVQWIGRPAYVESDCSILVQALRKEENRVAWAGVLMDIRATMQLLPKCKVQHVRREANQVAHNLA
jgi:hypothetical protein